MSILDDVLGYVSDDNISFGTYHIPKRVKIIADKAFRWCVSLKKITIPERIVKIGAGAFRGCTKLKEISLPFSVEQLGDEVFYNCKNLKGVKIFSHIDKIGNNMFNGCDKLKTVNLPNYIKTIGSYAFYNCKALNNFATHIPTNKSNKSMECDHFESFDNLEKIGVGAFLGCQSLENLVFSEKIIDIGHRAFESCHKLSLNIGTSLFYIDFLLFKQTFDVKSLVLYNCKVDLDNYEDSIKEIRIKELKDRLDEYLRDNSLPSYLFSEEDNNNFIYSVLGYLNINNYDYRRDFKNYVHRNRINYIPFYSLFPNNAVLSISNSYNSQTIKNQRILSNREPDLSTTSYDYQTRGLANENIYHDEINPIYKDIPFDLYEYGNKTGTLDIIRQIKERIDIYLKNNNISNQKCFEYIEHKGFILEMLDCILNDKNYDYIVALNNYMKN